jgi:hypothetical protein
MSLIVLAAVGTAVLYVVVLAGALRYARQNSGGTSAFAEQVLISPLVDAGFRELGDAVCGPRPEEVRDVEAR